MNTQTQINISSVKLTREVDNFARYEDMASDCVEIDKQNRRQIDLLATYKNHLASLIAWRTRNDSYYKNWRKANKGVTLTSLAQQYAQQDAERLAGYVNGMWCYTTVTLTVKVSVISYGKEHTATYIDSLGGVESDSGKEYFDDIREQLTGCVKAELRGVYGHDIEDLLSELDNAEYSD